VFAIEAAGELDPRIGDISCLTNPVVNADSLYVGKLSAQAPDDSA
jgi:hypothetical protein